MLFLFAKLNARRGSFWLGSIVSQSKSRVQYSNASPDIVGLHPFKNAKNKQALMLVGVVLLGLYPRFSVAMREERKRRGNPIGR